MKKATKLFAIVLTLAFVLPLIAGCAKTETPAATTAPVEEQPTTAVVEQPTTGSTAGSTTEAKQFDAYPRPKMGTDGKLVVCSVHIVPTAESQSRSVHQIDVEIAHRGWKLIDVTEQVAADLRDALLNCINQEPDAILLGNQQSMESYQDVIDQARNAGIGVYNNDNQLIPGIITNSTMPNGVAAMELLYAIENENYWSDAIGFIDVPMIQVSNERIGPMKALLQAYPNTKVLASEDALSQPDVFTAGYTIAKPWLEKYGHEMTGIIGFADLLAYTAAEAIIASGDPTGEYTWAAGIDGGSQSWGYIRDNTPFKYNYSQPFELYTHKLFELMDQLQLKGMNPGDPDCLIKFSGDTMYSVGTVVTRANVPDIGASIHSAYNYYDPTDTTAWYNWPEGGGPLKVEPGARATVEQ